MNFENPTNYAAFRKMVFDMTMPELDAYDEMIQRDIRKYIQSEAQKIYLEDWSIKLKIIAEERKNRRERISFDIEAA